MSGKKEEERNEKVIRGLLKLPPNRRCINCDSMGPQYVCTNFWTFICITCSGIHREFTHRVKSVSMSKFTTQEVEALQMGGNQQARELFLKVCDMQQMRLPNPSKLDDLREFIKAVYVEKKYAGGQSFSKPPRDTQNHKGHEEHRRASSFNLYSESPPYGHELEEIHKGNKFGILSRKPSSDRGYYHGKISFVRSPSVTHDDRFANEICASRASDYSDSSNSDLFRSAGQSPSFPEPGTNNHTLEQAREFFGENADIQKCIAFSQLNARNFDGLCRSQRSPSSTSIGSLDSSSLKSASSCCLADLLHESDNSLNLEQNESITRTNSAKVSAVVDGTKQDLFSLSVAKHAPKTSDQPTNLFATSDHPHPTTLFASGNPSSENLGWATFDSSPVKLHSVINDSILEASTINSMPSAGCNLHTSRTFDLCSASSKAEAPVDVQFKLPRDEVQKSVDTSPTQIWNAFDGAQITAESMFGAPLQMNYEPCTEGSTEHWHSFESTADSITCSLPATIQQSGRQLEIADVTPTNWNPFAVEETSLEALHKPPLEVIYFPMSGKDMPLEAKHQGHRSNNPFDSPFDSDVDAHNVEFMDMAALADTLPTLLFPVADCPPEAPLSQVFPQLHVGDVGCHALQNPCFSLPNGTQTSVIQASVMPLSGNPFA